MTNSLTILLVILFYNFPDFLTTKIMKNAQMVFLDFTIDTFLYFVIESTMIIY